VSNNTRIICNGTILDDSGKVPVEPLYTANYYIPGLPESDGLIYCEFTVEGSKKWYRGAAKLLPTENTSLPFRLNKHVLFLTALCARNLSVVFRSIFLK
jgi:hypothetical protein